MAGKSIPMTKAEVEQFAARLRKLAAVCDRAIEEMDRSAIDSVAISGKPTADLCFDRIHSFVTNVIGEAMNPNPTAQKPKKVKEIIKEADAKKSARLTKVGKVQPQGDNNG